MLPSLRFPSPGNPTLFDDVRYIRNVLMPLVEEENDVVVVGHSAEATHLELL